MNFGFGENYKTAEGGMNDQRLYIYVNALYKKTELLVDSTLQDLEDWEVLFECGIP